MILISLIIRLTSKGPIIFAQKRIGRNGRLFPVFKFRTMYSKACSRGIGLTRAGDARVTPIGAWLRKLKLDELPQFYNVLRGEMSVVGPRPKLPEYADDLNLIYRPGITGAASLAFRNEEELLASVSPEQVESYYHDRIKPVKACIDREYMLHATFTSDLRTVFSTVLIGLRSGDVSVPDLAVTDIAAVDFSEAGTVSEVSV